MAKGSTATEQSKEHHEPATQDWPAGIGETSVWPLLTGAGVATLYLGAMLLAISHGSDAIIPSWPGAVVFLGGVALFAFGVFGWLYHGFIYHYWQRGTDRHESMTLRVAMLLFLGTEIATFGAGFAYYFYVRVRPWPPESLPHLLSSLVLVNTLLLVASSVTIHFAHHALREGDHQRFEYLTGATVFLGILFLGGQVYEYYEFVVVEGFTVSSGLFASAFFGLTGLHGLHVSLGVVVLAIVFVRARWLDQYSAERMTSVSTASMYWHFVDAIWLFLVVSLYVVGSIAVP
ncbi:cytochrome c oxidase subunit 3 [Haloarcula nitratireducens]|uniref:Heme-copper oxidase subunit III n=1 Tax=Haloarcula nitratireducens TaxID=2487749 RepID=A0AAW4PGJ3_9EURY|nr:heme-copper oxidase subunit III [Halomicroarcula nitratireducens]MBX0296743.1 heme-copper oxidase subunit III [Halomicroarcula nitratireducens]